MMSAALRLPSRVLFLLALTTLTACGRSTQVRPQAAGHKQPIQPVNASTQAPARRNRLVLPAVLEAAISSPSKPAKTHKRDGLEGAWARVFLRANPGPFQYVAYEITARGSAGVMSHLRGMMGRRDVVARTSLVSRAQLRTIFDALQRLNAAGLRPPKVPVHVASNADDDRRWPDHSQVPIYELSYRYGGVERTVVVAAPYRSPDLRYAQFINTVRAAVVARVGTIGYHGPTGTGGKAGYLYVDSVPTATVELDGVSLPNKTPVLAFAARPGKHVVVLRNAKLGLTRTFKVVIRAGRTTSLEVDLR